MIFRTIGLGVVVMVMGVCSQPVSAAVLYKTDGTKLVGDKITVTASGYVLKKGPASIPVSFRETAMVGVKEPPQLGVAIKQVKAGEYTTAIPTLKKIMTFYKKLNHDVTAGAWLVTAYVGAGKNSDAIKTYDTLKRSIKDKKDIPIQLRRSYWEALDKTSANSKLQTDLSSSVRTGNREVAAEAQVRRSDSLMKQGKTEQALKTGYLRTVLLFPDVKDIQPRALLGAVTAYEKLELTKKAAEYKGILMKKYPESPEAKSLK